MAFFKQKGDILVQMDNNPVIVNGDFSVSGGDATKQNIKHALQSVYNDLLEAPQLATNINDLVNDDEYIGYIGRIQKILEADGMTVNKVTIAEGPKVNIDAGFTT